MQIEKGESEKYTYEFSISNLDQKYNLEHLKKALEVDEELNKDIEREIEASETEFTLKYKSDDPKRLRIAVMKQTTRIITALEAMELFSRLE